MRVSKFQFQSKSRYENVILTGSCTDCSKNLFTVINGENGTGKSAMLRILSDAALGLRESRQNRLYASEISLDVKGSISRTIAISGTQNDRFPLTSGIELGLNSNRFDLMEFYYYGPKHSGNYVSASKASNTIAHSILSEQQNTELAGEPLLHLFDYMGFGPEITFDFKLSRNTKKIENSEYLRRLEEHLAQRSKDLPSKSKLPQTLFQSVWSAIEIYNREEVRQLLRRGLRASIDIRRGRKLTFEGEQFLPFQDFGLGDRPHQWLADMLSLGILTCTTGFNNRGTSESVALEDLSSGQWQLMNSLVNLSINSLDETLVLIDEPENSLHPKWQTDFLSLVRRVLSHRQGCHVIIATHSPLIAASLLPHDGNLIRFYRASRGDQIQIKRESIAYGWLPGDVLQSQFDMDSARAPELTKATNEALALLRMSSEPTDALRTVARRLRNFQKILPAHDPLNDILNAIIDIAFVDDSIDISNQRST
ncbi:ATP-binding protein [Brucella anthropi]|uniref:ATP-binding protein n=1 Tax=Brucella anthropi TaxID=529 RepID=UPI00384D4D08